MVEFSKYYVEFLKTVFTNIWKFIKAFFQAFADFLVNDVINYVKVLINSSAKFNILDWLATGFVMIVNIGFVIFVTLRLFQFLRRYFKFRKREVEKDELLEEISALNYKIEELVKEKNAVFAMKVSQLGLKPNEANIIEEEEEEKEETEEQESNSRFIKLINVDKKYSEQPIITNMITEDMISLPDLVQRFVNFSASEHRLYYDKKIISVWFAGLATSKILILEGISGTGKTSLPYAMGKFFQNDAAIISVQPSWRDKTEIIGYLNEFTKRFNETDFLEALYETTYRDDLNFIILDELNLARIEYYFAEFLSIMEMPDNSEWLIDITPNSLSTDPVHLERGKILVPQNVWFIGTANKDDSTFTITDKVYDRAIVLSMNEKAPYIDAPATKPIKMSYEYLLELFQRAYEEYPLSPKTQENLAKIDEFITANFKITFGNRIMKQIRSFVPVFVACGFDEAIALDYFLAYKILRKFESLNLSFLHKELNDLIAFFDKLYGKNVFKESNNYLRDLIKNS